MTISLSDEETEAHFTGIFASVFLLTFPVLRLQKDRILLSSYDLQQSLGKRRKSGMEESQLVAMVRPGSWCPHDTREDGLLSLMIQVQRPSLRLRSMPVVLQLPPTPCPLSPLLCWHRP
jgi:hypothetical protein